MAWFNRSAARHSFPKLGLALILAASIGLADSAVARSAAPEPEAVTLSSLPAEAQKTHQLIQSGGPFPHDKDGTVFGNRERLLPASARGFYREYTVKTPGARDRGARRIVCGGKRPARPEACYYTGDHYASFRLIAH